MHTHTYIYVNYIQDDTQNYYPEGSSSTIRWTFYCNQFILSILKLTYGSMAIKLALCYKSNLHRWTMQLISCSLYNIYNYRIGALPTVEYDWKL